MIQKIIVIKRDRVYSRWVTRAQRLFLSFTSDESISIYSFPWNDTDSYYIWIIKDYKHTCVRDLLINLRREDIYENLYIYILSRNWFGAMSLVRFNDSYACDPLIFSLVSLAYIHIYVHSRVRVVVCSLIYNVQD